MDKSARARRLNTISGCRQDVLQVTDRLWGSDISHMATLAAYELHLVNRRCARVTVCRGSGQGITAVFERLCGLW